LDELNLYVDDDAEWIAPNNLEHVNSFAVEDQLKKHDSKDQIFPETKKKDFMFDS